MAKSAIEWTDSVWNPVSGCTRVSAGCDHCYAVSMTKRLEAMKKEKYSGLVNIGKGHFNGVVKCHEDALTIPLKARKPRRWFVNSMSDLFHKEVPFEFIDKVFAVMALCPHHTFQVLTKRPERMAEYLSRPPLIESEREEIAIELANAYGMERGPVIANRLEAFQRRHATMFNMDLLHAKWPLPNVWIGTSVEDQATADERIPHLVRCPAVVRFLSCEPLLGPVDLTTVPWIHGGMAAKGCAGVVKDHREPDDYVYWEKAYAIHWVIVGGESGPGARPMDLAWVYDIVKQCDSSGVAVFVKQLGKSFYFSAYNYGDDLLSAGAKGGDWDHAAFPEDLKIREFPEVAR